MSDTDTEADNMSAFMRWGTLFAVTLATTLASRIVMLNDRVVTADNTQGRRSEDVRR